MIVVNEVRTFKTNSVGNAISDYISSRMQGAAFVNMGIDDIKKVLSNIIDIIQTTGIATGRRFCKFEVVCHNVSMTNPAWVIHILSRRENREPVSCASFKLTEVQKFLKHSDDYCQFENAEENFTL